MIDTEKREFGSWWLWILALVVVTFIVLGFLGYAGKFTGTAVERAVFEQSYQKQAGDRQRIATWKAQIAEVETRLSSMDADDQRRPGLEAQLSALRIQLRAAEATSQ